MSLFAAFALGLLASGHCVLMCGGIAGALGVATGKDSRGRPRLLYLVGYQLGRILSYALAGLLVGTAGGALIALLDIDQVRLALRIASATALLLAALVMLGVFRDPGSFLGKRLWPKLAPMGKRLLPVDSFPRALGFGAIWGWMPCGFVYTILLVAALGAQPLQSAAVMAAFGLGTLPAMLATSWGAPKLVRFTSSVGLRQSAGVFLIACSAITLAAPMLVGHAPWLQRWLPFDCS
ncbi:sulfite exporter TauE/SafE family protein [Dokdonella sp.]|uniref:sulfite exporter TauE/SafE family protein n=1 Tax=Dokdonella sp. TaxID=2291710 RepID=UPI003C56A76B